MKELWENDQNAFGQFCVALGPNQASLEGPMTLDEAEVKKVWEDETARILKLTPTRLGTGGRSNEEYMRKIGLWPLE